MCFRTGKNPQLIWNSKIGISFNNNSATTQTTASNANADRTEETSGKWSLLIKTVYPCFLKSIFTWLKWNVYNFAKILTISTRVTVNTYVGISSSWQHCEHYRMNVFTCAYLVIGYISESNLVLQNQMWPLLLVWRFRL